jgi:hypothetical protein
MRTYSDKYLMLDTDGTVDAAAVSSMMSARNYKCAKITVEITDSYDGTLKFYGTEQETKPDLSVASDDTNQYAPIDLVDYDGAGQVTGSTGIDCSALSDGTYIYEVQSNGNQAVGCAVSSASAGSLKVYIRFYDDAKN